MPAPAERYTAQEARHGRDRGFGFIDGDDGQRYFFHRSALQGTDYEELAPCSPVEFGIATHAEGDRRDERPRAVNVHLADEAIPAVDTEALPRAKTGT